MELLRRGLELITIKGLESSEGSVNIPIALTVEGNEYDLYTQQIHIRYINQNKVYEEMLPSTKDGFYIPSSPLAEPGPIELAIHLIKNDREYVTNEVCFTVQRAPNGNSQVKPSEYSWQQLVDQYIEAKLETFANKKEMEEYKNSVQTILSNNMFHYKVGTSDPNTTNCPNGYFYFQLGD